MQQISAPDRLLSELRLDRSGVPIYVQLRDQALRALAAGVLEPGDQMPTMRQVAVALRIDLNTVRRAYDELERLGALRVEHGRGSFVARPPPAPDPNTETETVDGLARQALATAQAHGLDPRLVVRRLTQLLQEEGDTP